MSDLGPFDTPDLVHCPYCGEPSDGALVIIVGSGTYHDCIDQRRALREIGWTVDDDGDPL